MNDNKSFIERIQLFMTYPRRFALFEMVIFASLLLIFSKWNPFGILYKVQIMLFLLFFMLISYLFIEHRESVRGTSGAGTSGAGTSGAGTSGAGTSGAGTLPSYGQFLLSLASNIGKIGLFVASILLLIILVRHLLGVSFFQGLLQWSTNIILIVGVIAIIYKVLSVKPARCNDNVVYKTVDFLPNKFIQFAEYIKREFKLTSKIVWVVLAIELGFISLRFLLPYLAKFILSHDGEELLTEPIYLENETNVSTFEQLYGEVSDDTKYNYNYALSTWFTINPQPPNTRAAYQKYTNILNYGNKPRVQFNSAKNTLRVQAEAGEGNKSIVDIVTIEDGVPLQKWNHIVINYDGGYMDVFLNGNLVGSKPNIAPYMQFDNVVVGENNGIEGGVRNVVYYDRTLTRGEVSLEYKLLGGARRRI